MTVGLQPACVLSHLAVETRSPATAKPAAKKRDWTLPGRAHLVGVGGSGMRALARVLHERGWLVSGSDAAADGLAEILPEGTRLLPGHGAATLPEGTDVVVHSDAVAHDNPELLAARAQGVATLSYFDVVGQLMGGAHGLAVAGTHGKSTTTAMAAWILEQSGRDPTVLCGAATVGRGDGGRAGRSQIMLAEACEYRANFLKLRPRHAVILGIEPDHFDCYPEPADAERAFARFATALAPDGLLLAWGDCQATQRAIAEALCRVETFAVDGATGRSDWSAHVVDCRGGRYRFDLVHRGEVLCRVAAPMPGRHNLLDALAAAALVWYQGVEPRQIAEVLGRFPGVRRRFEVVGTWCGATVIDDFAHHPTELSATLKTVLQVYPRRRICCVFQPHQVSRTTRLLDELAATLHNGLRPPDGRGPGDRLWIADIFRAREGPPQPGEVTAADLADRVRRRGHDVAGVHRADEIARELPDCLGPGDVLLVIGAGDISRGLRVEG